MKKLVHKPGTISFKTIAPFLNTDKNNTKYFSYAGLGLGIVLLLCCVQMFYNINQLLKDKSPGKNGYDFISVTKTITNANMGKDNRFTPSDVLEIQSQPFIKGAAPLNSNQFRAKASAGSIIPFSTDLFLESINNEFIDTVPPSFSWHPGQMDVPIIFSADFLEMYNIFAPPQGLPQLSESSIGQVNITLECYGPAGMQPFRGHIVALSDRINSVLVPETFLSWANATFGNNANAPVGRIYLKTADANDPLLLKYLQQKNYHINLDKTKFGRIKQVLQAVIGGLGLFALVIIAMAMMMFSFYLRLMIAKSKENLQLLLTLGYSPSWLSKTVAKKWIKQYVIIIFVSIIITAILQFCFWKFVLPGKNGLSPFPHLHVVILSFALMLLCIAVNSRLVKKLLYNL